MHKTTTSRLILVFIVLMLTIPIINFNTDTVKAKDPKQTEIYKSTAEDKTETLLADLVRTTTFDLKAKIAGNWVDKTNDLKITYTPKNKNSNKFTFEISSKENTSYKTGFIIPYVCNNYTVETNFRIFLNMNTYYIVYDYSDIGLSGDLWFTYGIDANKHFWFNIETIAQIPKNTKKVLDPQFVIVASGDTRGMDPCPPQRKLVRFHNGTLFMCYYVDATHKISVARSLNNGVTWVSGWFQRGEVAYDAGLVATYDPVHGDILHLYFSRSWVTSQGLEYMNFTANTGLWSSIYNVTAVGESPECFTVSVNSSNALWCFWYDNNATSGGHNSVFNRTFYKNVWGPIRVKDTGTATLFPCTVVDYDDVVHVTAFGEGASNIIWYWTITNGVSSTPYQVSNGAANDQTNNNIVVDSDNNIFISWIGYNGVNYMIRFKTYWSNNGTWSKQSNLSAAHSDGTYYAGPSQTMLANDTLEIVWGISKANASDGVWYIQRTSSGVFSSLHHVVTNYKATKGSVMYQNYQSFMVPTTGFCYAYWNITATTICYLNWSVNYSFTTIVGDTLLSGSSTVFTAYAHLTVPVTSYYVGFKYGRTSACLDGNTTSSPTTYTGYGATIAHTLSSLSPGTYYYARAWCRPSAGGVINFSNLIYGITLPSSLTDVVVTGGRNMLNVRAASPGTSGFSSTTDTIKFVCRYSSSEYPGYITSNLAGFNATCSSTQSYFQGNITGLVSGIRYYLGLFLYIEDTGSPLVHSWTPAYFATGTTSGGQYNLTFLWENSSYGNPFYRRHANNHTLIVYYNNKTEINVFNYTNGAAYGYRRNQSQGNFNRTYLGIVQLNLSYTPLLFEFRWNSSQQFIYPNHCVRKQVVVNGTKIYKFWVTTNRKVYGISTSELNDTLIPFSYTFNDYTGIFIGRQPNDAYYYAYDYLPNGTRRTIDAQYIDTTRKVYPMLLYGVTYFSGVACAVSSIDNLGFAPTKPLTSSEVFQTIDILNSSTTYLSPQVIYRNGYDGAGIYIFYSDALGAVISSNITVYDHENGSLMFYDNSVASIKNYTFSPAAQNRSYEFFLVLNSSYSNLNVRLHVIMYNGVTPRWSYATVNETLTTMFGVSPIRLYEDPSGSAVVPWVDILVFGVFLFIICTFGGAHAGVSCLGGGAWMTFAGSMLSGSPVIWATVGGIIMFFSFLYMWGEKK